MKIRTLIIALAATCFALGAAAQTTHRQQQQGELDVAKSMEVMLAVFRDVNLFYVDTVKAEKLVGDAMKGMLQELDPYTEYIPEKGVAEFEFATTGKYAGIGALIRQRGEWVEIAEPYADTPSARAGLKAGDRLIEIDGQSLHKIGSSKVSSMLKGDADTKFSLKYRPIADTNTTKTIEITRQRITVPGVPYYGMVSDSIGYIMLNNFTEGCANEVRAALEKLRANGNLQGLILDLRSNGGGIVSEAIDIVGMFVPRGTEALKMRGKIREMNSTYTTRNAPVDLTLPLAVLINSSSASASEIVAGALQDLDRAVIIGQRSFGKGLVQSTRPAPYNGMFKVTTAKYYTPSGRCIQALDYTHRREDGSVGHIPDTLIKSYTTKIGRKVYDGGGIMPDQKLEAEYMSKFGTILMAYGFIDDFANQYAAHNTPAQKGFKVDDKLYAKFVDFMADKTIEYESLSERKLKELREASVREKYNDRIVAELDAIAAKIKDDKMVELTEFKEEIKELLASSIITRLYFAAAAIEESLLDDKMVHKAIEILDNTTKYNEILKSCDTQKN